MKTLLLIAMMAGPTTVFAADDANRYEAYKQRRAERRAYALEARRAYNALKGPHVYRTAIAVPAPITPFIAIEKGWVRQPAIPVRPLISVGLPAPYPYVAPVQYSHYPSTYFHFASRRALK